MPALGPQRRSPVPSDSSRSPLGAPLSLPIHSLTTPTVRLLEAGAVLCRGRQGRRMLRGAPPRWRAIWHRQGTDRDQRPNSPSKAESECPFLRRAVPSPWHSVLVSSGDRRPDPPGPGEGGWRHTHTPSPAHGGLRSSRICTNPATSTRLTKDTRGLRGDAMRGADECTLRSRAG